MSLSNLPNHPLFNCFFSDKLRQFFDHFSTKFFVTCSPLLDMPCVVKLSSHQKKISLVRRQYKVLNIYKVGQSFYYGVNMLCPMVSQINILLMLQSRGCTHDMRMNIVI